MSVSNPASILLLQGQTQHADKKYEAAVKSFTRALDFTKIDRIHVLDLRIGAYVKLQKVDLAIKDAQTIIKLDRTDGRGYLRCGQLERLMQHYDAAIRWYEHGLRRVPPTDRLYSYMETQLLKARELHSSKIRLSKPTDPMTTLPIELVEIILGFFDYRQRVAILRVSKAWNRLLTSLGTDTINFRNARRPINYLMLSACLRRLSKSPKTVVISGLNDAAAKSMRQQLERWINYRTLENLEIDEGKVSLKGLRLEKFNMRSIVIGAGNTIAIVNVYTILRDCQNLQRATFSSVSGGFGGIDEFRQENLQRLEMNGSRELISSTQLFQFFPNLSQLALRNFHFGRLDFNVLIHLHELDISNSRLCLWKLPGSLVVLKAINTVFDGLSDPTELPNLKVVDIYGCQPWPHLLEDIIGNDQGVLRELSIDIDNDFGGRFSGLVKNLSNLETLRLKAQSLVDNHSQLFVEGIPKLRKLILENAAISGVFLVEILKAPSCQLQSVVLRDCGKVSPDAITWAREQVKIQVSSAAEQNLGGRRLRLVN